MAAADTTTTNDVVLAQISILNCEHMKTANTSHILYRICGSSCKELSKQQQKWAT